MRLFAVCLAASLLVLASGQAQVVAASGHAHSTITDLGVLPGGTFSQGLAINDEPTVVGLANDSQAFQRPFWDANTGAVIGFADNFDSASVAIPEHLNNNREMAGTECIGSCQQLFRGVYWNPAGQAFGLPPLAGIDPSFGPERHVRAHGINKLGQIVGTSQDASYDFHAVLWQNKDTPPMDLGVNGDANAVNDLSHVVGVILENNGVGSLLGAFLWRSGSFVRLPDLPGQTFPSAALAINNNGLIAGEANVNGPSYPVTWHYDPADPTSYPVIQQLPIPAGFAEGVAKAVNDAGDVVGYVGAPGINSHAILWHNGVAIDLGIVRGGNYSVANGINDLGEIVGTGTVAGDNLDHALLWTTQKR